MKLTLALLALLLAYAVLRRREPDPICDCEPPAHAHRFTSRMTVYTDPPVQGWSCRCGETVWDATGETDGGVQFDSGLMSRLEGRA